MITNPQSCTNVQESEAFLPEHGGSGHVRLCYASADAEQLAEGAERLGRGLCKLKSRPPLPDDDGGALAWV